MQKSDFFCIFLSGREIVYKVEKSPTDRMSGGLFISIATTLLPKRKQIGHRISMQKVT